MSRAIKWGCIAAVLCWTSAVGSVLNLGVCRFKGEGGKVILELYLDLPRSAVTHRRDGSSWFGSIRFIARVSSGGLGVAVDEWRIDDPVEDPEKISPGQRLIDARIYELTPGLYRFDVSAIDSISHARWNAGETVDIAAFPADRFSLSDIELAGYLLPAEVWKKFDRGGFALLPNPRRLFGEPNDYFYYYIEGYPADNMKASGEYRISRLILNGVQDTVKTLPPVTVTGGPGSFADVDSVSLAELPRGSYTFVVGVVDPSGSTAVQRTRFFVDREMLPPVEQPAAMDSATVMDELNSIGFLLSRGQRKAVGRMSISDKVRFLDEFWRRHDDDPSTPDVPLRRVFRDRVREADHLYTTFRSPGHKTDRGRIYVLYGKPSDCERHPLDIDSKPFEIWKYDRVEGGVIFVFVDRSGLGEYELVHSTMRGEISNRNWYDQYVKRSGVDTGR